VAEQRFNAVMEVLRDGLRVVEVADRYGVSRRPSMAGCAALPAAAWTRWLTGRTGLGAARTRCRPRSRLAGASCAGAILIGQRRLAHELRRPRRSC
jgi:hypothetical protein